MTSLLVPPISFWETVLFTTSLLVPLISFGVELICAIGLVGILISLDKLGAIFCIGS
jgi:hypothetical protein